tara:strand:- start:1467 stop:1613 length:147 start_codon:yes stop_codon:yes gene_type:complete
MRENKKQLHYSVKPSFKKRMENQANKEGKNLNEFMLDVHLNYLKKVKG